ncbi:EpsG family protein [Bacillus sp. V3-13]|uniref:EpsG family protein n=1 Tax=Bacillus sp. V3-13 TaxID=2053728 RepID=UPI0015E06CB6|nr:EpsG family protein [Bacillus sp. V3-13]
MTIYYINQLILGLFSLLSGNNKNYRKYFLLLICFITLFVGLRYNVGNDYAEYFAEFYYFQNGNSIDNYYEPIYALINKISTSPIQVFFICSVLSFLFLYLAFNYFNPEKSILLFSLYFGFYLILFNIHIIRQGVAIAIIMYSWKFIVKQKFWTFSLLVLIAMGFHVSAIFAFPMYFLARLNIPINFKFFLIWLSPILLFIIIKANALIFSLLSIIPFFARYAQVYSYGVYSEIEGLSFGFVLNIILFVLVGVYINKLKKNNFKKIDKKKEILINIFFYSIIFAVILRFNATALRANYFYQVSNIFIFALIIDYFKEKKIVKLLLLVVSFLYLYQNLTTGNAVLEYKTIFQR